MEQRTIIMAIVTTKEESLRGGGVPVFIAKNKELLQKISNVLEKTLDASVHEVDEDTTIIVAH